MSRLSETRHRGSSSFVCDESDDCSKRKSRRGAVAVAAMSETIRGIVSWILEDAGHACFPASNRSELIAILEAESVDIAVIDVVPPEFDTPPFVARFQPSIILLLENGQVPREIWKSSNVIGLVIKPFSAGQIVSSVASAFPGDGRKF